MPTPTCSIITPCHNSESYLSSAIGSVKSQSAADWELILIDDGSTDSTPEICQAAQSADARIQHIRLEHNSGPAIARNIGISAARGRYIFFLDSDDHWEPDKLATQLPYFSIDSVSIVHSNYYLAQDRTNNRTQRSVKAPEQLDYYHLLAGNFIGCLTAGYDTHAVGKVYMPNIPMRQDWGLWLRILRNGGIAYCVQKPLATLRMRKDSLTANKMKATYYSWKLLREEGRLSASQATINTIRHIKNSLKRKRQ